MTKNSTRKENGKVLKKLVRIFLFIIFIAFIVVAIAVVVFISNLGLKENKMFSNFKTFQVPSDGKEIYYKEGGSPTCLDACSSLSRVYAYDIPVDELQNAFISSAKKQGYIITNKYEVEHVSLEITNLDKKIDHNDLLGFVSFFEDFSQIEAGRQSTEQIANPHAKSYLEVDLRYGYYSPK